MQAFSISANSYLAQHMESIRAPLHRVEVCKSARGVVKLKFSPLRDVRTLKSTHVHDLGFEFGILPERILSKSLELFEQK